MFRTLAHPHQQTLRPPSTQPRDRSTGGAAGAPSQVEATEDPTCMRVRGLCKSYGDNHVIRELNLDVRRGAMNAIASGSGKSVLLRQLLGLERPDAGTIELDGRDIVTLDQVALLAMRRQIGVVAISQIACRYCAMGASS